LDFQKIRKEYENEGIQEQELLPDPMDQFRAWYAEAEQHCPGPWYEPNAMALATTDLDGNVSVRWVLLKGMTAEGIRFFTNYDSAKGQQLAANPKAAVAIHWPYLGRQVRIEGVTERTSRLISEEYFHSRPRGSQLGALASRQSQPVASRKVLENELQELTAGLKGLEVPLPEDWGGYLLKPRRMEFWQGRLNRLHDRIVYMAVGSRWEIQRLSP
jgi:pyridoxamine 5'-phosphate oxidase